MSDLLDAMDELNRAQYLVHLISMTTEENPGPEEKAISVACEAIEGHFDGAMRMLEKVQADGGSAA